jgi:hypothetical protein
MLTLTVLATMDSPPAHAASYTRDNLEPTSSLGNNVPSLSRVLSLSILNGANELLAIIEEEKANAVAIATAAHEAEKVRYQFSATCVAHVMGKNALVAQLEEQIE